MRKLWLSPAIVLVTVVLVAVVLASGGRAVASEAPARVDAPVLKVGDEAPRFNLPVKNPDAAGLKHFGLANFVGPDAANAATKGLLVSFFATWCGPCKKELPFLAKLQAQYRDQGLQVVSVMIFEANQSPDQRAASVKEAEALFTEAGATFPLVHDNYGLLARRWLGLKFPMPSVFLVKKDGTIALVKQGYDEEVSAFLTAEVEKLIGG